MLGTLIATFARWFLVVANIFGTLEVQAVEIVREERFPGVPVEEEATVVLVIILHLVLFARSNRSRRG